MPEAGRTKKLLTEFETVRDDIAAIKYLEHIDTEAVRKGIESKTKWLDIREHEVCRMISELPSGRWAAALNGKVIQGMSVKAIACDMGVSTSSVYSYISQASKWLDANFEFSPLII